MMTCEIIFNLELKFVFSPDVILCGLWGSKHQLTLSLSLWKGRWISEGRVGGERGITVCVLVGISLDGKDLWGIKLLCDGHIQ